MINTIQAREDINQANWINVLQEEAITETNNTKEIVKDFEETEDKISDIEDKTLSNEKIFPSSQRWSCDKKEKEIVKINDTRERKTQLDKRVKNKIDAGEKFAEIVTTNAFKSELYCKFWWYKEEELNFNNIKITHNTERNWIVVNCSSTYEAALSIPKGDWNIIEHQEFIKKAEEIALNVLDQEEKNIIDIYTKNWSDWEKKAMEYIKNKIIETYKNTNKEEIKESQLKYMDDIIRNGWWAEHFTTDIIDGKHINIWIWESLKVDKKPVVTMKDTKFLKKLYGLEDKLKNLALDSTFTTTYKDILDHEFQHQITSDFMQEYMNKIRNDESKLPKNTFEAHLFFSTKNELMSFLWNHYDKNRNIDFKKIKEDIRKVLDWHQLHSYSWPFGSTKNEAIMNIFRKKVEEYVDFIENKFKKIEWVKEGYKPSVEIIKEITAEFIKGKDAPTFKLTNEERKIIIENKPNNTNLS